MSELRDRRYRSTEPEVEIELPKGDVTEGVVRIGDTVRRPHQPQSYAVAAYLDHLQSVGFSGAPRYLGRDDQGRDVLDFVDGDVAGAVVPPWALTDEMLASVARLVRRLHEASAGYVPSAEPFPVHPGSQDAFELVTHLDVTPQNVVVRDGEAIAVVDFDLAGPSTRQRDSYNTAMHWVPLLDPVDVATGASEQDQLRRLRVFADAYEWTEEERRALPTFGAQLASRTWERMKYRAENNGGGWARMWSEGVGDLILRRRAWLEANAEAITAALL